MLKSPAVEVYCGCDQVVKNFMDSCKLILFKSIVVEREASPCRYSWWGNIFSSAIDNAFADTTD
jgi:hypothetical protein